MKDNNFILLDEEGEDSKSDTQNKDVATEGSVEMGKKLEEKVKLGLFGIFCHLLKGGLEITPWKVYILVGIEFVQFLQFSFHPTVRHLS
jgi:hypothetical protein